MKYFTNCNNRVNDSCFTIKIMKSKKELKKHQCEGIKGTFYKQQAISNNFEVLFDSTSFFFHLLLLLFTTEDSEILCLLPCCLNLIIFFQLHFTFYIRSTEIKEKLIRVKEAKPVSCYSVFQRKCFQYTALPLRIKFHTIRIVTCV